MEYHLMNKDVPCLALDTEDYSFSVLNNDLLPYPLKDFVRSTGEKDLKGSVRDNSVLRDYLAARTLNLSRENAKIILNVAALPQSLAIEQKLKIVIACSGLSMQDNIWLKKPDDDRSFTDVCLRRNPLSEASYQIAILGKHVSATIDELKPDLTTEGLFPKFWRRLGDDVELWKTDRMPDNNNSKCEVLSSRILDLLDAEHIRYRGEMIDARFFSVCRCLADDDVSFVPIQDIMDWQEHIGGRFADYINNTYETAFADMVVFDYIAANTDRHSGNWGVLTDSSNCIIGMAPLFDHNQAFIADCFGTDINDLIYEPTGLSFMDSIKEYAPKSGLDIQKALDSELLTEGARNRLALVAEIIGKDQTKTSLSQARTVEELLQIATANVSVSAPTGSTKKEPWQVER